jgi:hypothetical protein
MRSLSKNIAIALAALVVVWLVAAPATAAAADVPGPDSGKAKAAAKPLTFLGFQDDEEDADTPAAFSKLSLKLYGGYSHVLAGDVNEGSDFYFEILEAYVAEGLGTVTGRYKPLHGGYNFGADLIYQINPALGIGLGVGYMRNSSESVGIWTYETDEYTLSAAPTLTAMPIRLGLFLTVPVGPKLDLIANAGAAYYLGLKFEGTQGQEDDEDFWMRMTIEGSERSGADIGFHGSLGFEYKLSPKLGFFVEAVGRYAKFKNFETVTASAEYSDGTSDSEDGLLLYIETYDFGEYEVSGFYISDTEPGGPEYREPKIDLSGFSLQAGFRIRF